YLHFSILSKFNLLFFSILFDTPPDFNVLNKKETPTSCRGFFVFQCLDTTSVISHILMLKLIIVVLSLGNVLSPDVFNICGKLF
ncbi:hypothetical protein, partial [Acinetobacter johnsonii]|uniref:hypothetical protein n=1 Tax=Acinetobacter johnsonii TaxID=40214 RepID=UPI0021E45271